MKEKKNAPVFPKVKLALAIIAAGIGLAFVVQAVLNCGIPFGNTVSKAANPDQASTSSAGTSQDDAHHSIVQEVTQSFFDAESSWVDSYLKPYRSAPSASFEDEIINLDGFGEVYVDEFQTVVGLMSSSSREVSFSLVEQQLLEKGWIKIESGISQASSFVKDRGNHTWCFVETFGTTSGSLVVIQVAQNDNQIDRGLYE